jgi:peptidoglycan-associated lipoprotein
MNYNKLVVNLLTATLILGAVVGCKKGPQNPTPIPGIDNQVGSEKPAPYIGPQGPGRGNPLNFGDGNVIPRNPTFNPGDDGNKTGIALTQAPMNEWPSDNGETFKSQIVYFDFDKSTIKASEKTKVEEVARRMKSEFQGKGLRVQGHCDERGTEEYNRALGERRALAVRELIVQLGLDPKMVETISWGEDKPAESSHNEAAWSKNRRAQFEVLTPPASTASKP